MRDCKKRTSDTHPIRVDFVRPRNGWGLIGMSICPGKKQIDGLSGHWERDLEIDLLRIREWGASIVISLIEAHEFEELQVSKLPAVTERLGMQWRHAPIRDRFPPNRRFMDSWSIIGHEILTILRAGENVFIHCKGGLGRTGQIAAFLLIEAGFSPSEAVGRVRSARPKTIETAVQEWFVLNYRPIFN